MVHVFRLLLVTLFLTLAGSSGGQALTLENRAGEKSVVAPELSSLESPQAVPTHQENGRGYDELAADRLSFQSEDPIKFGANDFNLARFVGNTPTGHKDPFGLSPIIETRTIDLRTLGVVQEEGETALAFGRRVHQIIQTLAKVANPNLESEVSFEGFGRADLFSEEDNLIIEIKPFNTAGADAGYNQLISYYGGVLNEGLADETTEYTLRLLLYF